MRLNPECIRDILLTVEEYADINGTLCYAKATPSYPVCPLLDQYPLNKVLYHARYCDDAGLLHGVQILNDGKAIMPDLTPLGHEFLANIRQETNWNKTKEIAQKAGSTSIDFLIKVAAEVVASLIKTKL